MTMVPKPADALHDCVKDKATLNILDCLCTLHSSHKVVVISGLSLSRSISDGGS